MDRKERGIKLKEIGRILVWVQIGKNYWMKEKIEVGRNQMDVKGIYWGKKSRQEERGCQVKLGTFIEFVFGRGRGQIQQFY